MSQVVTVDPSKCTACRTCEIVCSMANFGEFRPSRSNIKTAVFMEEAIYLPLTCFQCEDPMCANICPSTALVKHLQTGVVHHNPDRCVGCKMCMLACPFGVIQYLDEKGIAAKCETCDGDPKCVAFCAAGALSFGPPSDIAEYKRKAFISKLKSSTEGVS